MGTGKERSITITSSSGLSQEEIERMIKEAEKILLKIRNGEKKSMRRIKLTI